MSGPYPPSSSSSCVHVCGMCGAQGLESFFLFSFLLDLLFNYGAAPDKVGTLALPG